MKSVRRNCLTYKDAMRHAEAKTFARTVQAKDKSQHEVFSSVRAFLHDLHLKKRNDLKEPFITPQ